MNVLIIGVGLIGGSFALALRDRGLAERIEGVEASEEHARRALERGLVDRIVTLEEGLPSACRISPEPSSSLRMVPQVATLKPVTLATSFLVPPSREISALFTDRMLWRFTWLIEKEGVMMSSFPNRLMQ